MRVLPFFGFSMLHVHLVFVTIDLPFFRLA